MNAPLRDVEVEDAQTAVVIDDDPETQQLMIRALGRLGVKTVGFHDAESALTWLGANKPPDLVIMDILLPRMSGYELGRLLRDDPRLAVVPLMLTTARAHLQDEELAVELRASFLTKPFRLKDYLTSIERLLHRRPRETPALVLVVDDDADILKAIVEVLRDDGYETITAMNGVEALFRLRSGIRPDLVLLDLMMPLMDGIELAEHVRKDPALANLPLLLLSADDQVASHTKKLGALTHMKKPADLNELLHLVERTIRFHKVVEAPPTNG